MEFVLGQRFEEGYSARRSMRTGTSETQRGYRGRLAPSPTGWLHLGHAKTFWTAWERARQAGGTLLLRNEDLDQARCRQEYVAGFMEDLRWFGIDWAEGPDVGGPHPPYHQSEAIPLCRQAFETLQKLDLVYPCSCSRNDILRALAAPHRGEEEPVYPGACRVSPPSPDHPRLSWRFRVPVGRRITFNDSAQGPQAFVAGVDFGDFVVWRHDGLPSYQLAVVVDDARMGVTEVVRGADLLVSTARQILLREAFGFPIPAFHHCPLMVDIRGQRLAKRSDAISLRNLRARGLSPETIRGHWDNPEWRAELETSPS